MAERILVIGSGGREHALAWKLAQSPHVQQVLVAPGNAGTADCGKVSNSEVSISNHSILAQYCKDHNIGLVVVGPEVPLAAGMVDDLTAAGVSCFGPSARAAQLEASKSFSKSFMDRHGIPTARWRSFTDPQEACSFIQGAAFPALVVKASGLAAGKGVIVARTEEESCQAVQDIMKDKTFGSAGETVVVEELLEGEEVSCLCFSDGFTVAPMPPAQDHKRLLDGDQGPNTGGMGAYCPTPQVSEEMLQLVKESILQKTIDGMREEGCPYVGVLYAGLMITELGPKVLEFNCRFGDPECQVLMPLLKSDLFEVLQNTLQGKLASNPPEWKEKSAAVTVVMASGGYPGGYKKGVEITGLSHAQELGLQVFHAGTTLKEGRVVTSGGRVLTVTAMRTDLHSALQLANQGVAAIGFPGAVFRRDIGHRAISFLSGTRNLTYRDSGVNIAAGNRLVDMIKPLAKATSRAGCAAELGGFAGLFDLKAAGFSDPILVSGTDGVGTKLKIAQASNSHTSLGQDLVAMCVNDVLAQGAEPLFFLDYFSCGQLDVDVAASVIGGIAEACRTAGCALVGGETAEMPGMYQPGEYDLAGFCVGAVERGSLLPRLRDIEEGDQLIGIASSGLHSNGFSLVRKVLERAGLQYSSPAPFGQPGQTLGGVLLTPTKIYSRLLLPVLRSSSVKAYAHITGGGLLENIPRVLPPELAVDLDASLWNIPPVFSWLQHEGVLSEEEMSRTFNCGLGAVLVVGQLEAQQVLSQVQAQEQAWIVGSVTLRHPGAESVVIRNLQDRLQAGMSSHPVASSPQNGMTPGGGGPQQRKTKVAVLISGTGTNLQALIDQVKKPSSSAEIVVVISNRPGVLGLKRASLAGIRTRVVDHKLYGSRAEFDGTIDQVLEEFGVEVVCLAGFMRILTGPFVRKWHGKLLNIHPSLLPSFKGVHAQRQALQAGVRLTGCTVHFVAEEVDAGAIIAQEAVPILVSDTEESLSERVKEAEHRVFPAALELVASGTVRLGDDGRITWSTSPQV
ncbi:LOW QUALITY PROTEIN: trifunctional purine biosynthetic protein adenosine-3 [Brienomyrus brachyistius]|uniref:LOW QUALITY PROTEIN: trifunctional purine biosynthetic protein adenosine-3 n=1 Tax=Brienomyrus brachyistius TaxID=42636 RepID=UPI0020B3E1B2|nr:LOW QUALITY PROTEIN: trifunctional purine biosynthetic protein adenosine-3 [Brienomyrus brachyistius]